MRQHSDYYKTDKDFVNGVSFCITGVLGLVVFYLLMFVG